MIHHTKTADAAVHESGWVRVGDVEVTAVPLIDLARMGNKGEHLLARLTYAESQEVAARLGGRLVSRDTVQKLHDLAATGEVVEVPVFTGTPIAETEIQHSINHDDACWKALVAKGWDRKKATANVGKHWVAGAPKGRSWLHGWWVPNRAAYGLSAGPGFIQPRPADGSRGPHDDRHFDDGTTTMLERDVGGSLGRKIVDAVATAASWLVSGLRPTAPLVNAQPPTTTTSTTKKTMTTASPDGIDSVTSWLADGDGAPMPEVRWICLHSAECAETSKSAENVAAFLVSRKDASAHFVVDNDSTVQQRSIERQAGAAPGSNHAAVHIELAGYAAQTAAQWSDAYSLELLERASTLVADLCARLDVPPSFVDAAGLLRGERGVTTHAEVSKAWKRSSHTDPGKSFPMATFLDAVRSKMPRAESIYDG